MQRNLSRLARELRKETCPRRVLDEVERRIEKSAPGRLRLALSFALGGLVLVCGFAVWRWNSVEESRQQQARLVENANERVRIASQTENALGWVGSMLLTAGAHSEKIISDRTVPPLRDSLEITKNKIIQRIDL